MIKKLLNAKMKLTKNQKGLTLIELLVVIVILGIIAAIAIPAIMGQSDKAKEKAAAQTNAVVKDAAQRYKVADESYTSGAVTLALLTATGKEYFQETPACPDGYTKADDAADLTTVKFCTK